MTRVLVATAITFVIFGQAAADNGLITKQSKYSVPETMNKLESVVKAAKGPQIFARLDFQALAGGKIRPSQLLIFGSGAVLPAFVAAAPTVAIDLPVKVLVWEDENGTVWVSYNTGEFLRQRHEMKGVDEAVKRFTAGAQSYVDKALQ